MTDLVKEIVDESMVAAMSYGDTSAWQSFLQLRLQDKVSGLHYELGQRSGFSSPGGQQKEYKFKDGNGQPVGILTVETEPGKTGPVKCEMRLEDKTLLLAKPDEATIKTVADGREVVRHKFGIVEIKPAAK